MTTWQGNKKTDYLWNSSKEGVIDVYDCYMYENDLKVALCVECYSGNRSELYRRRRMFPLINEGSSV